jgi:hypothetical protein
MTYYYDDSEIRAGFSRLERQLDEITDPYGPLESVRDDVMHLKAQVEELDDQLRGVTGRHEALDCRADQLSEDFANLTEIVRELGLRMDWLGRYTRRASGATVYDLDAVGADIVRLLDQADAGRQAEQSLLPAWSRTSLETQIKGEADARAKWQTLAVAALAASRALVLAGPETVSPALDRAPTSDRADPVSTYQRAAAAYRQQTGIVADRVKSADAARRELLDDDRRRTATAPLRTAGRTAWAHARAKLRTRIAESLADDHLPPEWFAVALGTVPPSPETDQWMDTATDVLTYRVTYGIKDTVVALGPEPAAITDDHRRQWHRGLQETLRRLER